MTLIPFLGDAGPDWVDLVAALIAAVLGWLQGRKQGRKDADSER